MLYCPACTEPPAIRSFPFCGECSRSLQSCFEAASFEMEASDRSPPILGAIDSIEYAYALVGRAYLALKIWKTHPSPRIQKQIERPGRWSSLIDRLGPSAPTIVPIGQSAWRAWKLQSSPALRVAHWVSRDTGFPVLELLSPPIRLRHQGQLSRAGRKTSKIQWIVELSPPSSILLVDDFVTTGHTLRGAAQALRESGAQKINAVCLGRRPLVRI